MEREFNLSIFVKLLKKFWYILLIAVIVAGALGTVYATLLSKDSYTVDASMKINIEYAKPPKDLDTGAAEGDVNLYSISIAGDFNRVYNKVFATEFHNVIIAKLKEFGYDIQKGDSTKAFYEITTSSQTYKIKVTMSDRAQALTIGNLIVTTISERLHGDEVMEVLDLYGYAGYVEELIDTPQVNTEESKNAMSWYLGLAIGLIAGIAIYFVLVLVLYFYNPKLQSIEEFNSMFDIAVLEEDSATNGLTNTAIKVRLALEGIDGAKAVAVNDTLDKEGLAAGLTALGAKVLVADVANLKDAKVDGGALVGQEIEPANIASAVASIKETYANDYDYIILSSSAAAVRKDYLILADVADGAVLKLEMNSNYRDLKTQIVELSELKNINLIGVVF